jgi:hypothetical protein
VVTFGRYVLANPDYLERVRAGAPLNEPDPATFYSGDERGYTDYPVQGRPLPRESRQPEGPRNRPKNAPGARLRGRFPW